MKFHSILKNLFVLFGFAIALSTGMMMASGYTEKVAVESSHSTSMTDDIWKPPHVDETMVGLGTDDEPLGVARPNLFQTYDVLLTQASTNTPTQALLENTLTDTLGTISRSNPGAYDIEFPSPTLSITKSICWVAVANATAYTAKCYILNDSIVRVTVLDTSATAIDLGGTGHLHVRHYD